MMHLRIDTRDFARTAKRLGRAAERQLPFAIAQTLTDAARAAEQAETKRLVDLFPTETPFTAKSPASKAATKSRLEAVVFIKPRAARYLAPYDTGGVHYLNPSKVGGTLLNPKNAPVNRYGNLSARETAALTARPDVFVGIVNTAHGPVNGIWQRPAGGRGKRANRTGRIKLLIRFGDALPVKQRFEFAPTAIHAAQAIIPSAFRRNLAKALATAR